MYILWILLLIFSKERKLLVGDSGTGSQKTFSLPTSVCVWVRFFCPVKILRQRITFFTLVVVVLLSKLVILLELLFFIPNFKKIWKRGLVIAWQVE